MTGGTPAGTAGGLSKSHRRKLRTTAGASIAGLMLLAPVTLWFSAQNLSDGSPSADEPTIVASPTLPSTGGGIFARGWEIGDDKIEFGTSEHTPLVGDIDGDGNSEPVIFDPTTGTWSAWIDGEEQFLGILGQPGDQPLLGRFSVRPADEPAVYRFRIGMWLFEGQAPLTLGDPGDIAVPADYDGDGSSDPAVFQPTTGTWQIFGSPDSIALGQRGDIAVPADYDGDGADEPAVFRPETGEWIIEGVPAPIVVGRQGDIPVPADYDGDGSADAAVYRQQTGEWIVDGLPTERTAALGIPLPFDADGDGAAERAVALTLPD